MQESKKPSTKQMSTSSREEVLYVLHAGSATPNEKVLLQSFWMRARCIRRTDMYSARDLSSRRRGPRRVATAILPIHTASLLTRRCRSYTTIFHPAKPIRMLFDREGFACILLDAPISFPDTPAFAWVFEVGTEVRRALVAECLLQDLEVFAIAGRDGDSDLDGSSDVFDGSADAVRESRAALSWSQLLKSECNSTELSDSGH